MSTKEEKIEAFGRLLDIMDELREKCPWDKVQTIETLRNLTIEETYELADAIMDADMENIKKELGDLLLHIVFYAKIGSEKEVFDITDVINSVNEKLIFRHPHVFGDRKVNGAKEVIENWEQLKLKEGNKKVLGGVPISLPAMIKAHRIQDKAKAVGFDWKNREDIWEKVQEEIEEVKEEIQEVKEEIEELKEESASNNNERLEKEFGDLLFSVINAARLYNVEPESALEKSNRKFIQRFNYLEESANKAGLKLKEMKLEEMEALWNEAKSINK